MSLRDVSESTPLSASPFVNRLGGGDDSVSSATFPSESADIGDSGAATILLLESELIDETNSLATSSVGAPALSQVDASASEDFAGQRPIMLPFTLSGNVGTMSPAGTPLTSSATPSLRSRRWGIHPLQRASVDSFEDLSSARHLRAHPVSLSSSAALCPPSPDFTVMTIGSVELAVSREDDVMLTPPTHSRTAPLSPIVASASAGLGARSAMDATRRARARTASLLVVEEQPLGTDDSAGASPDEFDAQPWLAPQSLANDGTSNDDLEPGLRGEATVIQTELSGTVEMFTLEQKWLPVVLSPKIVRHRVGVVADGGIDDECGKWLCLTSLRDGGDARSCLGNAEPLVDLEPEASCAICLDEFSIGDLLQPMAACAHVYHADCAASYAAARCFGEARLHPLDQCLTCPLCRGPFYTLRPEGDDLEDAGAGFVGLADFLDERLSEEAAERLAFAHGAAHGEVQDDVDVGEGSRVELQW
eukprot:CAMPEP_0170259878 /NCGR_PEP_ID=MMETSP0116_2-20130129/29811_1 /TAXON_ID=400756 /ORGANISM="Durinskia baltica, Strain CSIRO CS-38" /LENGTH=476 /DNA_ID=CAMNT_0010510925 /DNA_START=56 /DNA_END=1486 /DNA_ORIENTATION=-